MENTEGLPAAQVAPGLTAQEEAFLRAYSESLNRMEALVGAGYFPGHVPSVEEQQGLLMRAGGIIAKAERMSLSAISSAMGKDKIYWIHHLSRVCESPDLHEAIKGLTLLARVHGLWEKDAAASRRQLAIIFNGPVEKPAIPRANLPFVIEAEYSDTENEAPSGT